MEVEASFPAHREALELVEQGEGPLDDVAEFPQAGDVGAALAGESLSSVKHMFDGCRE